MINRYNCVADTSKYLSNNIYIYINEMEQISSDTINTINTIDTIDDDSNYLDTQVEKHNMNRCDYSSDSKNSKIASHFLNLSGLTSAESNSLDDISWINESGEKSYWDTEMKKQSQWTKSNNLNFRRRLILDTPFSTRSTISYGLIVYAKDTKRWAIIQRKHSVEFLLFIRGLYRLTYLPLLLSCITKDEAAIIERCLKGGPKVFEHIYLKELELYSKDLEYALIRMAESRIVVSNILIKLDLSENKLKWTWPKGRLHISADRETPFDCAKREFMEEVEITLPPPLYISDTYVSENVKTITGRNIESRYWIYIIPNEISMNPPNSHPEVANRIWSDTETCKKLIHYGLQPETRSGCIGGLFKQVVDIISFID